MLPEDPETGYAISAADLLADFLTEHPDDPAWSDARDWPEWTDGVVVAVGAPLDASECFEPPAWSAWLNDRRQPD